MTDRILPLHGIHNFRDYGDYPVAGGHRLRKGVLFRSGQHVDATDEDLAQVARIGLATVIDLRGDSERATYPCARPGDFDAEVIFVEGETAGGDHAAPHIAAARNVVSAAEAHDRMVDLYALMPWRPNLVAIFQRYFNALADRSGPSLLHCLAGKDRTGVAVALLHDQMGVHQDDIMADYMLTNVAGNIERRIEAGAKTVRANFGPTMAPDAVRTLMSVHPQYLETGLSAIRERHGSIDAYVRDVLGVTPDLRRRLEERLID